MRTTCKGMTRVEQAKSFDVSKREVWEDMKRVRELLGGFRNR